jgi:hypothetical protein
LSVLILLLGLGASARIYFGETQALYEHILNSAGEGIYGLDSTIDPADKVVKPGKRTVA